MSTSGDIDDPVRHRQAFAQLRLLLEASPMPRDRIETILAPFAERPGQPPADTFPDFGDCPTCDAPLVYLGEMLLEGLAALDAAALTGAPFLGTTVDLVGCPACHHVETVQVRSLRSRPQEISAAKRQEWADVAAEMADWYPPDAPVPWGYVAQEWPPVRAAVAAKLADGTASRRRDVPEPPDAPAC